MNRIVQADCPRSSIDMYRTALIGTLLILLVVPAIADTPDDLVGEEDDPAMDTPEPLPECGDGVCQPEIEGVCPEDCDDDLVRDDATEDPDDTPVQSNDDTSSGLPVLLLGSIAGIILIGIILYLSVVPEQEYAGQHPDEPDYQDGSHSQPTSEDQHPPTDQASGQYGDEQRADPDRQYQNDQLDR